MTWACGLKSYRDEKFRNKKEPVKTGSFCKVLLWYFAKCLVLGEVLGEHGLAVIHANDVLTLRQMPNVNAAF